MKNIFIAFILLSVSAFAQLEQVWATPQFTQSGIKIIDIRTPEEWKETGIIQDSYTITFFDQRGNFNIEAFLDQLNKVVKKEEQFALVCRVGSRTGMVSEFLSDRLGYHVINLKGGIMKMIQEGYQTVPYKNKLD
ncbi:MAG: hypothetical protein RL113_743 [Pseudomonadota bacterium]|jgi:rhodanese-related sulfurtransferase